VTVNARNRFGLGGAVLAAAVALAATGLATDRARARRHEASATAAAPAASTVPAAAATAFKSRFLPSSIASIVGAGNGIYTVYLSEECGTWTAVTGVYHPAGASLNVLYGDGAPGTSTVSLRLFSTGADLSNIPNACGYLCGPVRPVVTPIERDGRTTGYRVVWNYRSGAEPHFELAQEVNVEGPVDGSETVENSVIRETHVVTNLGTTELRYGLRKMWDWQVAGDDGPWLGSCDAPSQACDRSLLLTGDGSGNGRYPPVYVINSNPTESLCPPGVMPLVPACGGVPPYLVAATVAPPSRLVPAPDAPDAIQFNRWVDLIVNCWEPPIRDAADCSDLSDDDTAIAYYYGRTPATAHALAPGEHRAYTQYVVAAPTAAGCPGALDPCREPGSPRKPRRPCSPQSLGGGAGRP
jgi:hypothetical protein